MPSLWPSINAKSKFNVALNIRLNYLYPPNYYVKPGNAFDSVCLPEYTVSYFLARRLEDTHILDTAIAQ
jgi:hypothetical protein